MYKDKFPYSGIAWAFKYKKTTVLLSLVANKKSTLSSDH